MKTIMRAFTIAFILAAGVFHGKMNLAFAGFEWIPPAHETSRMTPEPMRKPRPSPSVNRGQPVPVNPVTRMPARPISPDRSPWEGAQGPIPLSNSGIQRPSSQRTEHVRLPGSPYSAQGPSMKVRVMTPREASLVMARQGNEKSRIIINPFPNKEVTSYFQTNRAPAEPQGPTIKRQRTGIPTPGMWPEPVTPPPPPSPPATKTGMLPLDEDSQAYEQVIGFGNDMPLALAIQQVVPPEYTYSFDKGIDLDHKVSWSGGKPWDMVLAEMVEPLNLNVDIRQKSVRIQRSSG